MEDPTQLDTQALAIAAIAAGSALVSAISAFVMIFRKNRREKVDTLKVEIIRILEGNDSRDIFLCELHGNKKTEKLGMILGCKYKRHGWSDLIMVAIKELKLEGYEKDLRNPGSVGTRIDD